MSPSVLQRVKYTAIIIKWCGGMIQCVTVTATANITMSKVNVTGQGYQRGKYQGGRLFVIHSNTTLLLKITK